MRETKLCSTCLIEKDLDKFYKKNRSRLGRDNLCKICRLEEISVRGLGLKQEVMNAYGGACVCCGESHILFLTIDHIERNGSAHREELGITAGRPFYRWLKNNEYPDGHQVLCYNCNCAKEFNNGVCPHQEREN